MSHLLFPEHAVLFPISWPLPVLIALPRLPFTIFLPGYFHDKNSPTPPPSSKDNCIPDFCTNFHYRICCVAIIYRSAFQSTLNSSEIGSYSSIAFSPCLVPGKAALWKPNRKWVRVSKQQSAQGIRRSMGLGNTSIYATLAIVRKAPVLSSSIAFSYFCRKER